MLGYIIQRNYPGKIISYETKKLIYTAEEMGVKLKLQDPNSFEIVVNREDRKSILIDNVITHIPDFIIPRMGATTTYFALAVIRHFERLGVYTLNSSQSIETVKDKLFQMQILAEKNFPVPNTILAKFPINVDIIETKLGFPVVVKALSGSQGSGVYLANDKNNFKDFMSMVEITNKEANFILQEFISSSRGRDLRVFVIGDKVMGAMQRKASDDNFKANFSRGGSVELFKISDEISEMCIKIAQLFNLDIAGIDLLFDEKQNFKICEVNSSPGFKGLEQAINKDVAKEILNYVLAKAKEA